MPAWVVPAAIAAGTAIVNSLQNWRARKVNESYVRQQNAYNSPKAQVGRFKAAGLNPQLVYGQVSSGTQSSTLSAPMGGHIGSDAAQAFNQTTMSQSQAAVNEQRIEQSKAVTEVNKLQAEVLKQNPLLHGALEPIVAAFKSAAVEKAANASTAEINKWTAEATKGHQVSKIVQEIQNMEKQFDLMNADAAIKAQVLKSKEFENKMLEVQERFISDGDLGPAQILDFVKLLLTRFKAR